MQNHAERSDGQLEFVGSTPPVGSKESIDLVWRNLMVYKTFTDADLIESRSRRVQAETAHEVARDEVVERYARLRGETRREANAIRIEVAETRAESVRVRERAEALLQRSAETITEARRRSRQIISDATQHAEEASARAILDTNKECTELKQQALREIKLEVGRLDAIRAATEQEREAERIFSDIAERTVSHPPRVRAHRGKDPIRGVGASVEEERRTSGFSTASAPDALEVDGVTSSEHVEASPPRESGGVAKNGLATRAKGRRSSPRKGREGSKRSASQPST